MAGQRRDVMDIRELLRRLRKKESFRRIAHDLGMSRNTVSRYQAIAEKHGLLEGPMPEGEVLDRVIQSQAKQGPQEQSKVEPYRQKVTELRSKGVEAQAIWRILQDESDFRGSYSSVKRFVRRLESDREPETTIRIEVTPGEEAQVDFGYAGHFIDPVTGQPRRTWVFVMTLSFSRHQYAQLCFDQSLGTWTRLHMEAFEFFGGVVTRVVLDNLKAGIVKASLYDPEMQRSYREMCEHYEVLCSPCRPRSPEHKGKVESGVRYVKRNALSGREFADITKANEYLLHWCLQVAGMRIHGTTHKRPLEVFGQLEKPALSPLPKQRWELSEWKRCKLHRDCHVVFDKAYYSAPYRLVGKQLMVRGTAQLVKLYHEHELVATHIRAHEAGVRRSIEAHLPPNKVVFIQQNPQWCQKRAEQIGEHCGHFIARLLGERPMDRLRGAQAVLRLCHRYGPARLEAACHRALWFEEVKYSTVKKILERGLDASMPEMSEAPAELPAPQTPRHARSYKEFFPDLATKERCDDNRVANQPDAANPATIGAARNTGGEKPTSNRTETVSRGVFDVASSG